MGLVDESNLNEWVAVLRGPSDTPYAGGHWRVRLSVPSQYPLSAPTATFLTPIFHPNVHFKTGEVCLDILKVRNWSWFLAIACASNAHSPAFDARVHWF